VGVDKPKLTPSRSESSIINIFHICNNNVWYNFNITLPLTSYFYSNLRSTVLPSCLCPLSKERGGFDQRAGEEPISLKRRGNSPASYFYSKIRIKREGKEPLFRGKARGQASVAIPLLLIFILI
jgi:hypothetical protein